MSDGTEFASGYMMGSFLADNSHELRHQRWEHEQEMDALRQELAEEREALFEAYADMNVLKEIVFNALLLLDKHGIEYPDVYKMDRENWVNNHAALKPKFYAYMQKYGNRVFTYKEIWLMGHLHTTNLIPPSDG